MGPPLRERAACAEMLTHRMIREQAIAKKLTGGSFDTYTIMDVVFATETHGCARPRA